MNIKSILRNIRFLALLIGNMMMAGCSNSDKPAYLEPHLITTEATHITRTEATLNGSATIEGETEMPKLLFRYGTSESMNLNTSEVHAQGADVSLVLTGLKAGTTYYYMLQGNNGRTTTTSNMMSFTTQPNISPKLSSATLLSHGPMSAFVSYEITDDGGEPMTETGCYVYLTGEPENKQKCIVENFDGKKGKIKLRIGNLERNAHYEFQPFARNMVGETIGTAIKYDTSDAITLNETGELIQLMGNHLYEYTQLTIAGTLNGEDLSCMRMMMGRDNDNAVTPRQAIGYRPYRRSPRSRRNGRSLSSRSCRKPDCARHICRLREAHPRSSPSRCNHHRERCICRLYFAPRDRDSSLSRQHSPFQRMHGARSPYGFACQR